MRRRKKYREAAVYDPARLPGNTEKKKGERPCDPDNEERNHRGKKGEGENIRDAAVKDDEY